MFAQPYATQPERPVPTAAPELGHNGVLPSGGPGDHPLEPDHRIHELGIGQHGRLGAGELHLQTEQPGRRSDPGFVDDVEEHTFGYTRSVLQKRVDR
ncbi:MAG: hypothetical protein L0I24_07060 [Pseudonocardia sp.]|nr:hypothetical protein [Pseudonocardia sp.]